MKKTISLIVFTLSLHSTQLLAQQQYRGQEITNRAQEMLTPTDTDQQPTKEKKDEGLFQPAPPDEGIIYTPEGQKTNQQISKALGLINQGKFDAARSELVKYLTNSQLWYSSTKAIQSQVLFLLGFANFNLHNNDEAEKFLKLQIEFTGTRDPEALNLLGLIKREKKEYYDSEYYLREAIRRAPPTQKPRYQYNLGNVYLDQGEWQKAYDTLSSSYNAKSFWIRQSPKERVYLIYSYAIAADRVGKKEESKALFEALEKSEYLPENLSASVSKYLGRKVTKAAPVSEGWSYFARSTALYDTNVTFLPETGPGSSGTSQSSMAYTVLFAPSYRKQLTDKINFQLADYLYYIFHQERVLDATDLLNNSTIISFYLPFNAWNIPQRLDNDFRIDLPFFNTNGLELFYQQYSYTPTWNLFWSQRLASKFYGTVLGIAFRKNNPNPPDVLSGVDLYVGTEESVLLGENPWKATAGYEFHHAQRKGSNFVANYNQISAGLLSPTYFEKLSLYFNGKILFGNYPEYSPLPQRHDFTWNLLWNINYALNKKLGFYSSINWMHNRSTNQPQFGFDKQVYEGGFSYLF